MAGRSVGGGEVFLGSLVCDAAATIEETRGRREMVTGGGNRGGNRSRLDIDVDRHATQVSDGGSTHDGICSRMGSTQPTKQIYFAAAAGAAAAGAAAAAAAAAAGALAFFSFGAGALPAAGAAAAAAGADAEPSAAGAPSLRL